MKIFGLNLWGKETLNEVETKNGGSSYSIFSAYNSDVGNAWVSPLQAYRFYNRVSPLQATVTKISDAIGDLPIILRKEDSPEDMINDHDILKLLKKPSGEGTAKQFLTQSATSLMLTKELWVVAVGLINQPPLELQFIHSYNIQTVGDPSSQWPARIFTSINGHRRYYDRNEIKGRFRYFADDGLHEIFPFISERNVSGSSGFFRGISPLTSLKDELMGYSASIIGNTSDIENSGSPSGVISPKNDNLSEEQWETLQDSMDGVTGPTNKGKLYLVPHSIEATFTKWAPKDMDYDTLQRNVKKNIWNLYSMPLPIVSEEGQTFSNFSEAQTAFYTEAVNEVFGILVDGLKWILETRYDMEGLRIGYNQFEVPSLRRQAIEQMKVLQESQVLTVNEIRASAGFKPIPEGDVVLVPSLKTTLESVIEGPNLGQPLLSNPKPKPNKPK